VKSHDTIAAVATPPGRGGIGVVRVSGPLVPGIAQALLGRLPKPRYATLAAFLDGNGRAIDRGLALFFPKPNSFTGEDVLELHGHGGPVVMDLLLVRAVELGARLAGPGEFSERAFLNGKLDLAQAEAIADLIAASSQAAARSALHSLVGEFSRRVHALTESLIRLRTHVEAAMDFPEEEIDFLADERIASALAAARDELTRLTADTHQGALLHDGMTVVLAGRPNAGKSSLLNALARQDTAIVSEIPGTTRDVLRERIHLDGMPLHVLDTAGLRESPDAIEAEGMRRAREAMKRADRVLLIVDDSDPAQHDATRLARELPEGVAYSVVRNKCDASGRAAGVGASAGITEIALSARTGAGLDALRGHLKQCMGFSPVGEGAFIARRRHLDALHRAGQHLDAAQARLTVERAGELAAEELRLAQQALGEITGEFTSEDLLGRIFGGFCIGK
jgi:tRNA modification GTPase